MDKKVILITGSNKGIGFEIVRQLARLGHTVILSARAEAKGLAAQHTIQSENLSASFISLDISNSQSILKAAEKIKTDFGKLDVLINNAAILLKEDHSLLKNNFS